MELVGDRRGQSIQIGAVLLFAALIVAFASYQAFVVPNQNSEVEFNHNQEVQSELQDLRNAIVSVGGSDGSRSVTVRLGTRYPSRLAARNPGPPSGSLRTVGTSSDSVGVTIENATVTGETGDFWNQSQRYNTGVMVYRPSYNIYTSAPETTYENTMLYNQFDSGNITVANQSVIDGTDISLVVLNGSLSRSSTEATSVDVRSVSSSTERVRLDNASGSNVTITFASTRSAAYWDFLENTQSTVRSVTSTATGNGFYDVSVELEPDRTYNLKLTKVGVGRGATDEDAAYLTDVDGDGATIRQGETTELTLEVRDRFNNPPDNAADLTVNGSVAGSGSLQSNSKTPDQDGRVTFVYEAPTSGTGAQEVEFSYTDSGTGLDTETPQNVSLNVSVQPSGGSGGGGGAYNLAWTEPTNPEGGLGDCSETGCTWDVGTSDSTLTLEAVTSPTLSGFDVEFAVNNTTVGTVSPTDASTDSSGAATTDVTANENGTVGVYTASGGASDVFNLTVENVGGSGGGGISLPTLNTRVDDLTDQATDRPRLIASYDVSNTNSSFERVEVTFANQNDGSADDTQQQTTVKGGLQYDNGYGAGDTYDVTYDVVYTIDGSERVVTSETVTTTPDAQNPSGNDDLSTAGSAQLTSWEIRDQSNSGNPGQRYRFNYDVGTGSFSEIQYGILSVPGTGDSERQSSTSRSGNNIEVNPNGGGYGTDYRLYILVRDTNGAVVDNVSVVDNADGSGTYSGP